MTDGKTGIDRRAALGLALAAPAVLSTEAKALAGAAETIALWPGRPPGAGAVLPVLTVRPARQREILGIARPTIAVYRPVRANGIGILVIPGGGYEYLAIENEGSDVADRLTTLGYTAFVLTYRLPAERWDHRADVPLRDAQRAMRLIRAGAAQFGIDAARLGVLGFSAGGHLAASLATAYDDRVYPPIDAADRLSAKPAFAGLMYAVTTIELPQTHVGSREHLIGPVSADTDALVLRRSPLRHIDAATPRSFLLHATDDTIVPVSCSLRWLDACMAAKVPVEAYILQRGGHGFGVQLAAEHPGSLWPALFDRWVRYSPKAGLDG